MKILVLVFIGMTAFLAESCQGDRTQGQQSVLKIAKSTVEVHSVWHDIYVATETGGQMRDVVYYSVRLRKSDRERARELRRDAQILPD
jgi:predicted membrane-bound mannosyltransferase